MNTRTRTRPVYLTDDERDLITGALDTLLLQLTPESERHLALSQATKFARSFTYQRIIQVRGLFMIETGLGATT